MRKNLLTQEINCALEKIAYKVRLRSPWLSNQIMDWIHSLSPITDASKAFQGPWMFPMFLAPRWLAGTLDAPRDEFHSAIVYSSLNGYLHIRLLDNIMDGNFRQETRLLPAAAFFHTEFHRSYQNYFASSHPFWEWFESIELASSEALVREAGLQDIDVNQFMEIAAAKLGPAKIPVAAVCYRYDRADLLQPWLQFMDRMACCWQLADDLFDWHTDLQRGGCTYFLSVAKRRKRSNESIEGWVAREGFAWGTNLLLEWAAGLEYSASSLNCGELSQFLARRVAVLRRQISRLSLGLTELWAFASELGEPEAREELATSDEDDDGMRVIENIIDRAIADKVFRTLLMKNPRAAIRQVTCDEPSDDQVHALEDVCWSEVCTLFAAFDACNSTRKPTKKSQRGWLRASSYTRNEHNLPVRGEQLIRQIINRAIKDDDFRELLVDDPATALEKFISQPSDAQVSAFQNLCWRQLHNVFAAFGEIIITG